MANKTTQQVASVFGLLHLPVPNTARLQRIAADGRSLTDVRDALISYVANRDGVSRTRVLMNVLRQTFGDAGVTIGTGGESADERLRRIAESILSGNRTLGEATKTIQSFKPPKPAPKPPPQTPGSPEQPEAPPAPDPGADPSPPKPVDYKAKVKALYPHLPPQLVDIFANKWAESGDRNLALAEMRASDAYDKHFAGNKRDDGTIRMTESEYFATKDAYRRLYQDYGLNPALFEDRFVELIKNDQSPAEHAGRLGAAYEEVINNIPQVREVYARYGGISMTDQAIFASVIDPTIGNDIINRRISVAQVGAEGFARGFNVSEDFAGRLVSGDVDQLAARTLFSTAEGQLATLDELVRRHRDPDDDFDIEEFADAQVFGDAVQTRRIRRVLRAEASLFSDAAGSVAASGEGALTGLSAR